MAERQKNPEQAPPDGRWVPSQYLWRGFWAAGSAAHEYKQANEELLRRVARLEAELAELKSKPVPESTAALATRIEDLNSRLKTVEELCAALKAEATRRLEAWTQARMDLGAGPISAAPICIDFGFTADRADT